MRGLHHIHLRKRRADHYEPFPARTHWKRILDRVVLTVGIIGPTVSLPQLFKLYTLQEASGLSAISWGLWAIMDVPWILYGFAHRERPIIFTYLAWFVVNSLMFVGVILYGEGLL